MPFEDTIMPIQKGHTFGLLPTEEEKMMDYYGGN
jgi:hypothetical protein